MTTFEVTSELYAETDFATTSTTNGSSISKFKFFYPDTYKRTLHNGNSAESDDINVFNATGEQCGKSGNNSDKHMSEKNHLESTTLEDKDGDLILKRRSSGVIEIEHRKSTKLNLVGLQIWRGALLLADYILHNEKKFKNRKILELGSGVGLTSIVSSFYARDVICTDINVGGLLELIEANLTKNSALKNPKCNVTVTELDFTVRYERYSDELKKRLHDVEYVITADVIYDDNITEAFVLTLEELLINLPKLKAVYIALEKRYVFTVEDMDSVAPSYEHFLRVFFRRNNRLGITRWKLTQVSLDFPRYFEYEKVKELILLKISK